MTTITVLPAQSRVNIGYLSDYRLITLKAIHAFDTSISRAFQTTTRYDFRAFDIRPIIYTVANIQIIFVCNIFEAEYVFSSIHYDYRVIPESFRWLVTKGRYTDAEMVINKIARINDREAPNITELVEQARLEDNVNADRRYSVLDLFKTRENVVRSLALIFIW